MILDAIVAVIAGLITGILALFPSADPPGWLLSIGSQLGAAADIFNGLGAWVPVSLVVNIIGAVIACWGIGLVIKVVRIVASYFLAGGGVRRVIFFLAALVIGVLIVRSRHRRKTRLSGTVADRPQFFVEPPARRLSDLGRERL